MTLSPMVRGYLEAALWASTDEDGEPLDAGHGLDDFAPEAIESAIAACASFLETAHPLDLRDYREQLAYDPTKGTIDAYMGHDFWFTRNGHGTGFWDRGLGFIGDRLTEVAKSYGEVFAYADAGDMIHFD